MLKDLSIFKKFAVISCYMQLALLPCKSIEATWSSPPVLVSQPGMNVSAFEGPYLSMNNNSEAIAIWNFFNQAGFQTSIFTARFTLQTGWQSPVLISSPAFIAPDTPQFINQADAVTALNDNGFAVAAWEGTELFEAGALTVQEIIT